MLFWIVLPLASGKVVTTSSAGSPPSRPGTTHWAALKWCRGGSHFQVAGIGPFRPANSAREGSAGGVGASSEGLEADALEDWIRLVPGVGSTGLVGCPGRAVVSSAGSGFGIEGASSQPASRRAGMRQKRMVFGQNVIVFRPGREGDVRTS